MANDLKILHHLFFNEDSFLTLHSFLCERMIVPIEFVQRFKEIGFLFKDKKCISVLSRRKSTAHNEGIGDRASVGPQCPCPSGLPKSIYW